MMNASLFENINHATDKPDNISDTATTRDDTQSTTKNRPLADQLRPENFAEIFGQDHLVGEEGSLTKMVAEKRMPSLILWGPPGCGKTTMARILSQHTDYHFEQISAIFSGVADLKKLFESAKIRHANGKGTLLFVDEIHRFNKAQQDAFLPVIEDGTIILIGATTENPSFELNAALLSRSQLLVLKRLDDQALEQIITRAEHKLEKTIPLTSGAREQLKAIADGDGRYFLSMIEQISHHQGDNEIDEQALGQILQKRAPIYDKKDESHYNLISALHKSMRGSDVDAALYWLARMLDGGEDPEFIARRLTRMAVEDVGLADPQALPQCIAAWDAYLRLGSPEGELALAQALIYLTTAPKSIGAYRAYKSAMSAAKKYGSNMPPAHILNAPTSMMKDLGYGAGYQYDPDTQDGFSGQNYFPDDMKRMEYYQPAERGFEREIKKRLDYWHKLRHKKQQGTL